MVTKRFPVAFLALLLMVGTFAVTVALPARACSEPVSRIVYAQGSGCTASVWVMNPDGSGATEVSLPYGQIGGTAWAPGQKQIAFSANDGSGSRIYLINVDGTGVTQLTDGSVIDRTPAFSTDGTKILFVSARTGDQELWVMNTDGTSPTRNIRTFVW